MDMTTQIIEGPRLDAGVNVKLDTSLENALPNSCEANNLSSLSVSSSENTSCEKFGCQHKKKLSHNNHDTCVHCGVFVPKNGVRTYKSKKMEYSPFFSPKTIYDALIRRSYSFKPSQNPEYAQVRQNYVEWLLELAEKLRISPNSAHLGVYLLDIVMFKEPTLVAKIQLYTPICLLLAAKTIELDERIPFIPKLRRYANPSFSIDDYTKAELHVLDLVDWNCQFSSTLELNEFFMCQGVLFSTDEVNENMNSQASEGLRENTQHGNTNHLENRADERALQDKILSPEFKENHENSFSEASTTGTNVENMGTPSRAANTVSQAVEDELSPKFIMPSLLKQISTPAKIEGNSSTMKLAAATEKQIEEIFTHFETSYVKLATLLIKDASFIEWEPKVVSAATMAFFRNVNRITPTWNNELEAITTLKYSQISACFELINKKYNTAFNNHLPKLQSIYYSPEKKRDLLSDLKLKNQVTLSDKTGYTHVNRFQDTNSQGLERKTIFGSQPKNVPVASNSGTAYMRDDLRPRTKFANGTINTEIPQRNPLKNPIFPPSYQASKFFANQEAASSEAGDTLFPCKNPSSNPILNSRITSTENVLPLQAKSINIKK